MRVTVRDLCSSKLIHFRPFQNSILCSVLWKTLKVWRAATHPFNGDWFRHHGQSRPRKHQGFQKSNKKYQIGRVGLGVLRQVLSPPISVIFPKPLKGGKTFSCTELKRLTQKIRDQTQKHVGSQDKNKPRTGNVQHRNKKITWCTEEVIM